MQLNERRLIVCSKRLLMHRRCDFVYVPLFFVLKQWLQANILFMLESCRSIWFFGTLAAVNERASPPLSHSRVAVHPVTPNAINFYLGQMRDFSATSPSLFSRLMDSEVSCSTFCSSSARASFVSSTFLIRLHATAVLHDEVFMGVHIS